MAVPLRCNRRQVLAYRLAAHNLAQRLPPASLQAVAAACGIKDSPPGSAVLALHARVLRMTVADTERALAVEKALLRLWALRTAPHIVPTDDAATFTTGLLPEDDASLRHFVLGAGPALEKVGMGATEVVDLTAAVVMDVLDRRTLPFRELSSEAAEHISRHLAPDQLEAWQSRSWYGPDQSLGEAIVHFGLYVVSLRGLIWFAPRRGNGAAFVRIDQWLGKPMPEVDVDRARAELVHRYLRCYGPTTAEHFGEWAGISPAAASRHWSLIEPGLVEVSHQGRGTYLHRDDLETFGAPPEASGVRLLPPHDPYLAQRHRETLLPDATPRRQVWRSSGNPGVVLVDGEMSAMWRPLRRGQRLRVTVEAFAPLSRQTREAVTAEAEAIAVLRGCTLAQTVFEG